MNTQNWAERLPPDMAWSERELLRDEDAEALSPTRPNATPSALPIPQTCVS